MSSATSGAPTFSSMLQNATQELRSIRRVLVSGDEVDPRLLVEFRDAVNHVRTAAWAVQQSVSTRVDDRGTDIASVLAGERIRAAYQLCKTLEADLTSDSIHLQSGPLMELSEAVNKVAKLLAEKVGK